MWRDRMNIYDKSYISKKATDSGFNRDTYEKVLRLVDVLEFINQDRFLSEKLALKGGTAINLLEFDMPRLSVDIDLDYTVNANVDQMKSERDEISTKILKFMDGQGYTSKKSDRQSFILDSFYFTYVNTGGNKDHIKFDINYAMSSVENRLFNREIISYSISPTPSAPGIMNALTEAIDKTADCKIRRTFHSDQGWAYQMKSYNHTLKKNKIYQSMSRKGNCLDNSVMENFFGIMKQEMYYGLIFYGYEDLKRAIEDFIEYYNVKRIKQSLRWMSPIEYRLHYNKQLSLQLIHQRY